MAAQLGKGVPLKGRSNSYHRKGLWAIKKKNGGKFPTHAKAKPEEKKTLKTSPKFYPADDVKKPLKRAAFKKPTKLRASITPGTVLILLAGRFKGKRVVFLKQLNSGLLMVSGPFRVNGVPIKRVNQAYVIATSTKINLGKMDLKKYTDSYFKATEKEPKKKGEEEFFNTEPKKKEVPADYIANQKAVDATILKSLTPELKGYLGHRFSLRSSDRPHKMLF